MARDLSTPFEHAMNQLLVPLLSTALLLSSNEGDWPGWRGPDGTGVSRETGWSSSGKEEDLWRSEVGLGYSCVSIAQGRLFTKGYDAGLEMDVVFCLDAETGEELWTHAYASKLWDNMHEGGTLSTPVVDGEHVWVQSRLGTLLCLDASSGKVLVERTLVEGEKQLGEFGIPTSPLVLEDMVVINLGRTVALAKDDGKTLWKSEEHGYSYAVPMPFEAEGRKLLAVFSGAGLVVLSRADGSEVARYPWTSEYNVNSATPIVLGNRIFISTGYNKKGCVMLELKGDELAVVWESSEMNNNMNGCVLLDGLLYGFDDAVLKCLTIDGDVRWSERGLGKGTVVASDGRLIVLSEKGELIVATAGGEGFKPLARQKLFEEGVCWTTPVLSGGRIYCRSNRGELVARDHRAQE
jgi:outer membrane protein assembly factor BamB